MQTADAVNLIEKGIENTEAQRWADLGCGNGTFTLALAETLAPGSEIFAYDSKRHELPILHNQVSINFQRLDFEKEILPFDNWDGILMANSLHYIRNKTALFDKLSASHYLIVEYENRIPNPWVPYPIPFAGLSDLFKSMGYQTEKLGDYPSRFGGRMYSLLAKKISGV